MAIKIVKSKYVYSETVQLTDEETNEAIFKLDINLTEEDAQTLKGYLRSADPKEVKYDPEHDEAVQRTIFGESYEEALDKFGPFYMDEFTAVIFAGVVGKLGAETSKRMESATMRYQKKKKSRT